MNDLFRRRRAILALITIIISCLDDATLAFTTTLNNRRQVNNDVGLAANRKLFLPHSIYFPLSRRRRRDPSAFPGLHAVSDSGETGNNNGKKNNRDASSASKKGDSNKSKKKSNSSSNKSSGGSNSKNNKNKSNTNKKKRYYYGKKKNNKNSKSKNTNKSKKQSAQKSKQEQAEIKKKKKERVAKEAAALFSQTRRNAGNYNNNNNNNNATLLDNLNPFQAGQNLRRNIDVALTTLAKGIATEERKKSIYYIDDTFLERKPSSSQVDDDFIPEVLVVGATGEVGRLVVKRMLLEGRYRIRVLVRNLYSQTLNTLGTGVTYCQGDLSNVESLEYAVTDVDKIVFCAGTPRPDESDFRDKFEQYMEDNNLKQKMSSSSEKSVTTTIQSIVERRQQRKEEEKTTQSDMEWEQLESVLELRAQMAEQVDLIGMQNLLHAYQNVRMADFGTSQAAKRTLFKFTRRPRDFDLFAIDVDDDDDDDDNNVETTSNNKQEKEEEDTLNDSISKGQNSFSNSYSDDNYYNDEDYEDSYGSEYDDYDAYDDEYGAEDYYDSEQQGSDYVAEKRQDKSVETTCRWLRNNHGRGVFVGKVPKFTSATGVGGKAAIISSRLRSRRDEKEEEEEDQDEPGIDLAGAGFGGFVVRMVGDGGNYEAFVRTGAYDGEEGIEYVCEFSTKTKPVITTGKKKQTNSRFVTVRLPFANFKPVRRNSADNEDEDVLVSKFSGQDIRHIGFRYRSASNMERSKLEPGDFSKFYMALHYIKVFRTQPEPEFVYLSDARIPRVVLHGMVRHDLRRLATKDEHDSEGGIQILDDNELKSITEDKMGRSSEETYYKYRGEELLKNSGLSYAIVRVAGYNESPSSEASTIELTSSNEQVFPVSRAEAAQVCASTLLDPNALNKSFYVSKKKSSIRDEDMSAKFAALPVDPLP